MHKANVKNKIQFNYQLDKNKIPTCEIIGVNIAAINMMWLLEFLYDNLRGKLENILAGQYICVCNVHATVIANEDSEYLKIQNESLMSLPDGGPLSTIGRLRGYKNMERTTGPDLLDEVFKQSVKNEYKHYFYGSTEETLKKMSYILKKDYPGIQIVGMYSPPFGPFEPKKEEEIIKEINRTNPDFIWVGLGAPKQERWMASQQGKLNGLMIGVGAGFDYIAANIKRAPIWMQKCNMEWFYRLIQEPKRLFKRYVVTNSKFIYYLILESFSKG